MKHGIYFRFAERAFYFGGVEFEEEEKKYEDDNKNNHVIVQFGWI